MAEIQEEYDEHGNLKRFLKKKEPEQGWTEGAVDVKKVIPPKPTVMDRITGLFATGQASAQALAMRVEKERLLAERKKLADAQMELRKQKLRFPEASTISDSKAAERMYSTMVTEAEAVGRKKALARTEPSIYKQLKYVRTVKDEKGEEAMPYEELYMEPNIVRAIKQAEKARQRRDIGRRKSGLRKEEQAALAEAEEAYQQMKYVPSIAQPRVKKIIEQREALLKALTTEEGWQGRYVRMPGTVSKVAGKMVYHPGALVRTKGLSTKSAEAMERAARGAAAMPGKLATSYMGAKRIEKGTKKRPGLSYHTAPAVSMGGFLFPMSGLQTYAKTKGMKRGRAGRPQGVYKHVIPGVGPVHVFTYRKWLRAQKHRAEQAMAMREQQIAQSMMKRGLPQQMAYAQAEQYNQLRQQQEMQKAQEELQAAQQSQYSPQPQQYQPQPQQVPYQAQQQATRPLGAPTRAPINMLGAGPINPFRAQPQQQQPMPQGYVPQGMKPKYDIFTGRKTYEPDRTRPESWVNSQSSWASTPEGSIFRRPVQIGLKKPMQGGYYQ